MTDNIGTAAAARAALEGSFSVLSFNGSEREVYIDDDIVYKVDVDNDPVSGNRAEWANYNRLINSDLPDNVKLPKTSLYEIGGIAVIAMEYIDGILTGECISNYLDMPCEDEHCISNELSDAIRAAGIQDIGYGNIIAKNSNYYLIDITY